MLRHQTRAALIANCLFGAILCRLGLEWRRCLPPPTVRTAGPTRRGNSTQRLSDRVGVLLTMKPQ